MTTKTQLFALGQTVATPGALAALEASGETFFPYMTRHVTGDWGDLSPGDAKQNDEAVRTGEDRVFSAYRLKNGTKIWIITEWDRSVTTILLPEDY